MDIEKHPIFLNAMPLFDARVPDAVLRIENGLVSNAIGRSYEALFSHAKVHGLYSFFVQKDLVAAKQWFYLAARLQYESRDKPGGWVVWTIADFEWALLSDSSDVISLYARLGGEEITRKMDNPKNPEFRISHFQAAIRGNYELVERLSRELIMKCRGGNVWQKHEAEFYLGLVEGNKEKMELALNALVEGNLLRKISRNAISEDFLAWPAIIFAKLAWIKGYQVSINSSLVPRELLAVSPLSSYDDIYSFLKPGWVPRKPSLWRTLFGK